MSEFSQSYHLATDDRDEAVRVLEGAGIRGFIFPPETGWTTFVAEPQEAGEIDERIVSANTGTLLHYAHAEDHGWDLSIYSGTQRLSHYECRWEMDVEVRDEELDLDVVFTTAQQHGSSATIEELQTLLHPKSVSDIIDFVGGTPADKVADALALPFYSWISWDYVTSDSTIADQVDLRSVG